MNFAYQIRMKFGTNHNEPTTYQIKEISKELLNQHRAGLITSDSDVFEIIKKYCPSAGTCLYKGQDQSDLNTLLALARTVVNEED
ncbi:hypothetical protein BCU71_07845 [Vibrio lentus]|nr:hypothetical protein BCU71_07845 [Vibrio lentus]PMK63676.1 hypothetical protein BCT93_10875 [Vibrio lentus]